MIKTSAQLLWKDVFHMSYYRGSASPPLNLQHTDKYHSNYGECCFHCYDAKSGRLGNYPLYYKILCSSKFNVQRATIRMEYFTSFLHEIALIKKG